MRDFIAKRGEANTEQINPELFDRTLEKSISDYIVSGLKVIESLPYIKFTNWKHIEDASKIDIKLNRRHIKDKNIDKNKDITKLVSTKDTAQEMLELSFQIDYEGDRRYIKKKLLIPSYVDKYHLLINGKEVLPQKQIVDMSTYNQKQSLKLKTTLTPIDIYIEKIPWDAEFYTTDSVDFGDTETFKLNLFTKELNPLYYFLAKFGVNRTINYFNLQNIVDVTDKIYNSDINHYFQINNLIYLEVDKRYFGASKYVRAFSYMLFEMLKLKKTKSKMSTINNKEHWQIILGGVFTTNTKTQLTKGKNVLVSFSRILDDITRESLRIDKKNLTSSYALIRWLIQNYYELRKKFNHDLKNKRMRCNELTAFYFIQSMSQRINQLLNKRKLTIESIERIFNWNSDELFRVMLANKNTLLKYDSDINCFDMLNGIRFSFLGSQGITGGKNIGDQFRDIYPSHLGRIDLNGVSHGKNTALTGFIVPKCKVYGNGFFTKEPNDPDMFDQYMRKLKKELYDPIIDTERDKIEAIKRGEVRVLLDHSLEIRNGRVVIHRNIDVLKNLDDNRYIIGPREEKPGYKKTYRNKKSILVDINKCAVIRTRTKLKRNEEGLIKITKK